MRKPLVLMAAARDGLTEEVKTSLADCGMKVREVSSRAEMLQCFRCGRPDLLLLWCPLNGTEESLGVVEQLRHAAPRFPIILLAEKGSESLAVAALRLGINDYFKRPFVAAEIAASVTRCLDGIRRRDEKPAPPRACERAMLGGSTAMRKVRTFLDNAARVGSNILITGETGTGKELAAEYIHQHSSRQNQALVSINCAALPDTLLESELFGYAKGAFTGAQSAYPGKLKLADGSTVFLDEIGDMSPFAQAKILRMLESGEVFPLGSRRSVSLDVRIIAATNRDLEALVQQSQFRKDLYFRLSVGRVHLPPLRERRDDIPLLVCHFLEALNLRWGRRVRLESEVMDRLLQYE